jgi:hypothetical protein
LKARSSADRRSTGSRSLPEVLLCTRASGCINTALTTAFMSPRTPLPLLANTAATSRT